MSRTLVIAEAAAGAFHKLTFEALSAAATLGLPVTAVVLSDDPRPLLAQLAAWPVDEAVALAHPSLAAYTSQAYTAALAWLIEQLKPAYVVAAHTYQARDFVPRLATRLNRPLIADATSISIENGAPVFERSLYQGKLNGRFMFETEAPNFVTVQAGAFKPAAPAAAAPTRTFAPPIEPVALPDAPFREADREVDLASAERIVAIGRGIGEESNLELARELAQALNAELAASRPICDNGWLPMDRQVGSSGQTVAPKLYLAAGISGAIQHLVGMKGAACIVAVNKDPDAPIFEVADYGIVADLFDFLPALTEALKAR